MSLIQANSGAGDPKSALAGADHLLFLCCHAPPGSEKQEDNA
jgi:hypothetical protein